MGRRCKRAGWEGHVSKRGVMIIRGLAMTWKGRAGKLRRGAG